MKWNNGRKATADENQKEIKKLKEMEVQKLVN